VSASITANQYNALEYVTERDPGPLLQSRAARYLERWCRDQVVVDVSKMNLLTINFHPDRSVSQNGTVIESVVKTARLQSQFESASTNGFALDVKFGVRAHRESVLFGGAYDDSPPEDRPKYGAVNLLANVRGGWPRFGSCYWVLNPSIITRCTVTIPGSHSTTAWWGSHAALAGLVAKLPLDSGFPDGHRFRLIDGPVELQVHGDILLERDVTALVIDPSFAGTNIEDVGRQISELFDIELKWAPALHSTGADWKVPPVRRRAHQLVNSALSLGEVINAARIGQGLRFNHSDESSQSVLDGARRYLWNRLLLTQRTGSSSPA
jgi:hypothetical protein